MSKDQFFFQGKYFDNEEDFWKYVLHWETLQLDAETLEILLHKFKIEIEMNIFSLNRKVTNRNMNDLLNESLLMIITEIDRRNNS